MYNKNILSIAKWLISYECLKSKNNYPDIPSKYDSFNINNAINEYDFNFTLNNNDYNIKDSSDINNYEVIYTNNQAFNYYSIYRDTDDNLIWIQNDFNSNEILSFKISPSWKNVILTSDKTNTEGLYSMEYYGKIFFYSIIRYGGIVLHGALMEYDNKGIIISAPSGTGKTTHARMWRDTQRALIINGDRALCRKMDGKWTGFGMPWCGTSGEYINRDVEISAIVVLEQAKENSVEKLDTLQAFNHMIPNITAPTWEKNLLNKAMDYLEDIVNEVPVYKLKCTPDIEAVEVLKKEIDKL